MTIIKTTPLALLEQYDREDAEAFTKARARMAGDTTVEEGTVIEETVPVTTPPVVDAPDVTPGAATADIPGDILGI